MNNSKLQKISYFLLLALSLTVLIVLYLPTEQDKIIFQGYTPKKTADEYWQYILNTPLKVPRVIQDNEPYTLALPENWKTVNESAMQEHDYWFEDSLRDEYKSSFSAQIVDRGTNARYLLDPDESGMFTSEELAKVTNLDTLVHSGLADRFIDFCKEREFGGTKVYFTCTIQNPEPSVIFSGSGFLFEHKGHIYSFDTLLGLEPTPTSKANFEVILEKIASTLILK